MKKRVNLEQFERELYICVCRQLELRVEKHPRMYENCPKGGAE